MLFKRKKGQRVRVRYKEESRDAMPHHDKRGTLLACASGKAKKNALIVLDTGELVIFPIGNLFKASHKFKGE